MFQTNKIQLTGNVTKAPETRQAGASTVTSARLVHNMEFPKGDGGSIERIAAIDLEIWGKRGEAFASYITTKTPVYVDGYLLLDQWEHEGKPHSRLLIRVNDWQFISAPVEHANTKRTAQRERGAAVAVA